MEVNKKDICYGCKLLTMGMDCVIRREKNPNYALAVNVLLK